MKITNSFSKIENLRYFICAKIKIPIVFNFYDSSGSCFFVKRKKFGCYDGIAFNTFRRYFDTEVHSGKFCSGGTDFNCIEKFLVTLSSYPDMVMIYTDGYGQVDNHSHRDRWLFLLSDTNSEKYLRGKGFATQPQ